MILRVTGGMHTAMNAEILAALLQEAERDEALRLQWLLRASAPAMLSEEREPTEKSAAADLRQLAERLSG